MGDLLGLHEAQGSRVCRRVVDTIGSGSSRAHQRRSGGSSVAGPGIEAVESVQRLPNRSRLGAFRDQVAARRGTNIGVVAAARRQLEYVYYALRDHHVRGLQPPTAVA